MGYIYLLVTVQLFKPWNPVRHYNGHLLFHLDFCTALAFYHSYQNASFAKIQHCQNECSLPGSPQVLLSLPWNFKLYYGVPVSLLCCPVTPWHTIWKPQVYAISYTFEIISNRYPLWTHCFMELNITFYFSEYFYWEGSWMVVFK